MSHFEPPSLHATATARTILLADELRSLPAEERASAIEAIRARDPALAELLESVLESLLAEPADAPTRVFTDFGSTAGPRPADLAPGTRLGAFELLEPLASGGMGTVWRARQSAPEREVAVKIVRRASADEAAILARIRHPSIATVHARGHEMIDGTRIDWIAMELVEGAQPIDEASRPLDLAARLALIRDTAVAVGRAHAVGIVHGDLKPSNVLVDSSGRVKVIDFGAGVLAAQPAAVGDARYGTPAYLAPELLAPGARATAASDVYAIGLILYAVIHGALPQGLATGSMLDILLARATTRTDHGPDGRPSRIPRDLAAILAKATDTDIAERYPDAEALAADLDRHLDRREVSARPRGRLGRVALAASRNPVAATAAMLTTLALVLAVALSTGFALYAARAAADAQTYADSIGETHESLLRVLEPDGPLDPADADRTMGAHLRDALARLERDVPAPRYADGVRAIAGAARTLEYLCIAFGMPLEAERAAMLIDVLERRLGRARASAIVGSDLDGIYARLASDPSDPAALASLKALLPALLHRQGVVRAEVFSRVLAVNFLRDPRLTSEVAGVLLAEAPDDVEIRLLAASSVASEVLSVARAGAELPPPDREALRRELRTSVDSIARLLDHPDAAVRASARGLANGLDLLASADLVAARCPELVPELIDLSILAVPRGSERPPSDRPAPTLNWFRQIPLRLVEAGDYDACRMAIDELDTRGLALEYCERLSVELARAELVREESGPASALALLRPFVEATRDGADPLSVPEHARALTIAAELAALAGDRDGLETLLLRARREIEHADPPLRPNDERDYLGAIRFIERIRTADPAFVPAATPADERG